MQTVSVSAARAEGEGMHGPQGMGATSFLKYSLTCQRLNEFTAILWAEDVRAEVSDLKVKTH